MYLKEVYMKNFKSFGKKTIAVKLSKGLTVISGPNGSGKSNVADAFLFVVGGQRTKRLRADNYAGLVFDGGKKGKGAKTAEVTLVFDNEDRKIGVEADTVEFTKKIKIIDRATKNVKTYYYINGRSSSHRDFQDIFTAARLSADGYNIVQQGTVNELAESTPTNRRVILDDTAGITKLDEDLERSRKRKEKVTIRLNELDLIIGEIDRQLGQLKSERNGALRYMKYKKGLFRSKAVLAHTRKQSFERTINEITERIGEYREKIRSSRQEIAERKARARELDLQIARLDKGLDDLEDDEGKKILSEIREYKLELSRARDRKITSGERIVEIERDIKERSDDISSGEKELSRYRTELEKIEKRFERDTKRYEKYNEEYEELSESMKDSSKKFFKLQKSIMKAKKDLEALQEERHGLAMQQEALNERINRSVLNLGSVEESENNLELEINETEWKIGDRTKAKKERGKERKKLDKKHGELRAEMMKLKVVEKELSGKIARLNQEYQKLNVRRRMAEESGYGLAVQKVLDQGGKGALKGIYGTIAQLAQVTDEYETALSTAAGGAMQAIVTKNDVFAAEAIRYLRSGNIGRAAFLPLNKMRGGRAGGKPLMVAERPGVIGFALDLVEFDEKFRNAFWYVFQDTLVVEDMDVARENMGGVRMVTLDGQLFEKSGAMVGGARIRRLIKFGKKDDVHLGNLRKELENATERQQSIAERLRDIADEFTGTGDRISQIAREVATLNAETAALEVNLKDYRGKLTGVIENRKGASDIISSSEEERRELDEKLGGVGKRLVAKKKEIERKETKAVESVPERIKHRMTELKEKRGQLLDRLRDHRSNIETYRTKIELWGKNLDEVKANRQASEANIAKNREIIELAGKDVERLSREVEKRESVEAKMSERMKELRKESEDRKRASWENQNATVNLVDDIESKISYIRSQESALSLTRQELGEVILKISEYGYEAEPPYAPQEELKVTIRKLKDKMVKLEPVNMVSLEVYDREKDRKDEILEKSDKLKKEMNSLSKMMRDVRKRKKEKFMEVYTEVDTNFREIYPQICTEGEGYLHLENMEEPFDGGLVIRARPPGKKMRDIRYLSGGEKSQVAIAFILALQRYDPSPFYVLDEVDQNLDRVNSGIIAGMIKKYSSTAQFIMISLHRDIMHFAHHLYGCYIKDGISKMVAVPNIQEIPFTEGEEDGEGEGKEDGEKDGEKDVEGGGDGENIEEGGQETVKKTKALVKVEEEAPLATR